MSHDKTCRNLAKMLRSKSSHYMILTFWKSTEAAEEMDRGQGLRGQRGGQSKRGSQADSEDSKSTPDTIMVDI